MCLEKFALLWLPFRPSYIRFYFLSVYLQATDPFTCLIFRFIIIIIIITITINSASTTRSSSSAGGDGGVTII